MSLISSRVLWFAWLHDFILPRDDFTRSQLPDFTSCRLFLVDFYELKRKSAILVQLKVLNLVKFMSLRRHGVQSIRLCIEHAQHIVSESIDLVGN